MSGPNEGKYICYNPGLKTKPATIQDECYDHITNPDQLIKIKAIDRTCCTYT